MNFEDIYRIYDQYTFVIRLTSSILIISLCGIIIYQFREFLYNHYLKITTVYKYLGHILFDLFVSTLLIKVGYDSYKILHPKDGVEVTVWGYVALIMMLGFKFMRYRKHSIGSGSQILELHKHRANLGVVLSKFNKDKPPTYSKTKMDKPELKLIELLLKQHISMLEKLLMLDIGYSTFERFTVTLLFYEKKNELWIKHKTVNFKGDVEISHDNSGWPKPRKDFKLKESLYTLNYDEEAAFDTFDISGVDYESVLSIPLYFPSGASSKNYRKDDLYAVLSYATNRKGYFSKLDTVKFMNFFLLERAIIDRTAYRILRRFYDK